MSVDCEVCCGPGQSVDGPLEGNILRAHPAVVATSLEGPEEIWQIELSLAVWLVAAWHLRHLDVAWGVGHERL